MVAEVAAEEGFVERGAVVGRQVRHGCGLHTAGQGESTTYPECGGHGKASSRVRRGRGCGLVAAWVVARRRVYRVRRACQRAGVRPLVGARRSTAPVAAPRWPPNRR